MRSDADLMVYVGARWHLLVREAVRLGCPPERAADVTTEALSRCRRDWGRTSQEEDVDLLVRDELEAAVRRSPTTDQATRERAADELVVLAPPTLAELSRRENIRKQRRRRRGVVVGLPLLLVVSGAVAVTARGSQPAPDDPSALERAPVRDEPNPAPGVVWYADGELHLDEVVLEIVGIRDLSRLGSGVVYGDDRGRVVHAAADGSRTLLGHKAPDAPVAATDETGLAAWYDPGEERVRVVEAATGEVVVDTWVGDEPEVVAVDGETVFLTGPWGVRALLSGEDSQVPVSPAGLVDVRARVRVFQKDDGTLQVVHSAFDRAFSVVGVGARLSPDGTLVATRSPTDDTVRLFDTATGAWRPTGVALVERVLAVAPGDGGTVTYVIDDGSGGAELRTCVTGEDVECEVATRIRDAVPPPLLAR